MNIHAYCIFMKTLEQNLARSYHCLCFMHQLIFFSWQRNLDETSTDPSIVA
ncbi:hypothetical protein J723_2119 [Acinetobacter sp. 1264765]|nr:hypothetical protein J723_2119 [Acinetobacter sp. 1264765]